MLIASIARFVIIDPDGEIGQVAAGAIIGGVIGGGWALLQGKSFGEVAAATIGGAVDGAIAATGLGVFQKIVAGTTGGAMGNILEQVINVISGIKNCGLITYILS